MVDCLFLCSAHSQPRLVGRLFICFGLTRSHFAAMAALAAWRAELVSSLKLPKFPARDLKRALEQAASVRASDHR